MLDFFSQAVFAIHNGDKTCMVFISGMFYSYVEDHTSRNAAEYVSVWETNYHNLTLEKMGVLSMHYWYENEDNTIWDTLLGFQYYLNMEIVISIA